MGYIFLVPLFIGQQETYACFNVSDSFYRLQELWIDKWNIETNR